MSEKKFNVRIKLRTDNESNWKTNNPVLNKGELAISNTDDNVQLIKVGDGVNNYDNLHDIIHYYLNQVLTFDNSLSTVEYALSLVGFTVNENTTTLDIVNYVNSKYSTSFTVSDTLENIVKYILSLNNNSFQNLSIYINSIVRDINDKITIINNQIKDIITNDISGTRIELIKVNGSKVSAQTAYAAMNATTTPSSDSEDTSAIQGISVVTGVTQTDGVVSTTTAKADKFGSATKVKSDVVGTQSDTKDQLTLNGIKKLITEYVPISGGVTLTGNLSTTQNLIHSSPSTTKTYKNIKVTGNDDGDKQFVSDSSIIFTYDSQYMSSLTNTSVSSIPVKVTGTLLSTGKSATIDLVLVNPTANGSNIYWNINTLFGNKIGDCYFNSNTNPPEPHIYMVFDNFIGGSSYIADTVVPVGGNENYIYNIDNLDNKYQSKLEVLDISRLVSSDANVYYQDNYHIPTTSFLSKFVKYPYNLPYAKDKNNPGIIKPDGTTLSISDQLGTLKVNKATSSTLGAVRPDGTTITIDASGIISAAGGGLTGHTVTIVQGSQGPSQEVYLMLADGSCVLKYTGDFGSVVNNVVAYIKQEYRYYSNDLNMDAYTVIEAKFVINDISISLSVMCLLKGTLITLSDLTTKLIEEVTYEDELLVWDFDKGDYSSAKPLWIKKTQESSCYFENRFSDGRVLKTVGELGTGGHRVFNLDKNQFVYSKESVGGNVYTLSGPVKHLSCDKINNKCEYYNIITDKHINLFANGILTSCRYNNIYQIKDMKFIKDNRKLIPFKSYNVPMKYYEGLRLSEQVINPVETNEYVKNLINLENNYARIC